MGDHDEWSQPHDSQLPNGILSNIYPFKDIRDRVIWSKLEERTAELIAGIEPNQRSEERRKAVADYVERLIKKCFPCQVITFGSGPLKTYLRDGDINLTAISTNADLKDSWASEVRDVLETEENNENAELHVCDVQYIQSEKGKIVKCFVENIAVEVSFNQVGGLCTGCFLEEANNMIKQNHLFRRSVILIKAWCYYESRILGDQHGLISSYALDILVLYIFHVYNDSFTGPLEVLCRFLEFYSEFDWERYSLSLWGPVPTVSVSNVMMTVMPPRKGYKGELLFKQVFLFARRHSVSAGGQDNQWQTFNTKHFNVIDPFRDTNNVGQSVGKGNYYRIRSAFALGARNVKRILWAPEDCILLELNYIFANTLNWHGMRLNSSSSNIQPVIGIPKINFI